MTREQRRDRAVYRELGIRAVIRAFEAGKPLTGFDGRTVRAAMRRLKTGYRLPPYVEGMK